MPLVFGRSEKVMPRFWGGKPEEMGKRRCLEVVSLGQAPCILEGDLPREAEEGGVGEEGGRIAPFPPPDSFTAEHHH